MNRTHATPTAPAARRHFALFRSSAAVAVVAGAFALGVVADRLPARDALANLGEEFALPAVVDEVGPSSTVAVPDAPAASAAAAFEATEPPRASLYMGEPGVY